MVGNQQTRSPLALYSPSTAKSVGRAAEPFDGLEKLRLRPLLERIGDSRVVLIGEASHGTAEFYEMRARITRELVALKGFRIIAVEADWPDARQIDRFVHDEAPDPHPERAFTRFPTWMWANEQVLDFATWLQAWNRSRPEGDDRAGFYGLDLYSLYTSMRAVLAYLDNIDPEVAALARARYGCLAPWEDELTQYGAAAMHGRFESCADQVARMLADLLARRLEYERRDGDRYFDATRNAAVVEGAERYYRALYHGPHASWNLRDRHMFETLETLLDHAGPDGKAVVWAHNSHLGDAGATSMSTRGETNVGEMARRRFGDACYSIGFGTDHGTVAAADYWDGPMRVMRVRPAREDSYEGLCHETGVPRFLLPLKRNDAPTELLRDALTPERLERAIGVIYRPQTELASHYFHASLPRQFDEWIWFDETRAVDALPVGTDARKIPETFPFGV